MENLHKKRKVKKKRKIVEASIELKTGSTLGLRTTLWATVTLQTVRLTPSLIPAARAMEVAVAASFLPLDQAENQAQTLRNTRNTKSTRNHLKNQKKKQKM